MASFNITRRNGNTYTILVDDEDLDRVLAAGSWHIMRNSSNYYAINGAKELLHRFLLNPPSTLEVDHVSRDTLDNRKTNLRVCTSSQNKCNRAKGDRNTSGFKGVRLKRGCRRWQARIKLDKKERHLGYFDTREEAFAAYCEASARLHGEFSRTT